MSPLDSPRRRHLYEPDTPAPPDARLPDVRKIAAIAGRRVIMADIELRRAQLAADNAAHAHVQAEQALMDHIDWVAAERSRLSEECQQGTRDAGALRRWRQRDQALIDSVGPMRQAVDDRFRELEDAQLALAQALGRQRALSRRNEKYGILIEKLTEA
ncbi:type III secretion protein [Roseateles amylovorans]|uniref:Type III secretion protein n=1 Tax=Roseateles amylovorans TaxID=2978473 RepID=A0ABY6B382_9BURK|nr:type III secretion protein [Roseateles amylovorans]UXH79527.1 type III secretion protein [Roseateles amylovorans]